MTEQSMQPTARTEVDHSILPLLLILVKHLRLLVGVPAMSGVIAVIYSLLSDPIYTATARILPPEYNEKSVTAMMSDMGGGSQVGNAALTLQNPTDLFVGILSSRTIMDAVITGNDLQAYYNVELASDARRILEKSTTIKASKDGIVAVAVEDESREKAAVLANSFVNEFYRFSESLAKDKSMRRGEFYRTAIGNARDNLTLADARMLAIEKNTGFTGLGGQDQAIVLAAAELQAQISAREVQLKTMASYATKTNPDYLLVSRELENLRGELKALKDKGTQTTSLIDPGGSPFVAIGKAPDAMLAHTQARREVVYWENIALLIGRFSEMGAIDVSRDMSLFQVLDWAIPPPEKSKPRTRVNMILAMVSSGFMSLLWVLVTSYIGQRCDNSEAFRRQWQELKSTLGTILRNPLGKRKSA